MRGMSPPASPEQLDDIRKLKQFGSWFEGVAPQVLPFDPLGEWASVNGQNFLVLRAFQPAQGRQHIP